MKIKEYLGEKVKIKTVKESISIPKTLKIEITEKGLTSIDFLYYREEWIKNKIEGLKKYNLKNLKVLDEEITYEYDEEYTEESYKETEISTLEELVNFMIKEGCSIIELAQNKNGEYYFC